jgi:hypothetical protein
MKTKSTAVVSSLFIQQWKKQGEAEAKFLLAPDECSKRFRKHTQADILAAISITTSVALLIATLLNIYVLNGPKGFSIVFGIATIMLAILFKVIKPGERANLTTRMHFEWTELKSGLRQHNLLYHSEHITEDEFSELIQGKFSEYLKGIRDSENREEFKKKAQLKKKLSNLHTLCERLNLVIPRYEDLFRSEPQVRWNKPQPCIKLRITRVA